MFVGAVAAGEAGRTIVSGGIEDITISHVVEKW